MKSIIWLSVAICVLILFTVLYIRYSIKKEKQLNEMIERTKADTEKIKNQINTYTKEKKENEELVQKSNASDCLDSFNAGLELLHKQAGKGKQRNN